MNTGLRYSAENATPPHGTDTGRACSEGIADTPSTRDEHGTSTGRISQTLGNKGSDTGRGIDHQRNTGRPTHLRCGRSPVRDGTENPDAIVSEFTIVVDTREQVPWDFETPAVRRTLQTGDYSVLSQGTLAPKNLEKLPTNRRLDDNWIPGEATKTLSIMNTHLAFRRKTARNRALTSVQLFQARAFVALRAGVVARGPDDQSGESATRQADPCRAPSDWHRRWHREACR